MCCLCEFICSKRCNKKAKSIDLTLSVLAVLVGRHVVDGVARGAVGRRAVGLGARQGGKR